MSSCSFCKIELQILKYEMLDLFLILLLLLRVLLQPNEELCCGVDTNSFPRQVGWVFVLLPLQKGFRTDNILLLQLLKQLGQYTVRMLQPRVNKPSIKIKITFYYICPIFSTFSHYPLFYGFNILLYLK